MQTSVAFYGFSGDSDVYELATLATYQNCLGSFEKILLLSVVSRDSDIIGLGCGPKHPGYSKILSI